MVPSEVSVQPLSETLLPMVCERNERAGEERQKIDLINMQAHSMATPNIGQEKNDLMYEY